MTVNSLAPAYVVIDYHSPYGAHKMTLPTTEYAFGSPSGSFVQWSGGTILSDTMIDDLVTLLLPFFPSTVSFDTFQIFSKADADADSILEESGVIVGGVGSNSSPGWAKATEAVLTMKSTTNGVYRLSLLDCATGNSFDKLTFVSLPTEMVDLVAYFVGGDHGWSARDNGQPVTFLQLTRTLNKALRRKYNMT